MDLCGSTLDAFLPLRAILTFPEQVGFVQARQAHAGRASLISMRSLRSWRWRTGHARTAPSSPGARYNKHHTLTFSFFFSSQRPRRHAAKTDMNNRTDAAATGTGTGAAAPTYSGGAAPPISSSSQQEKSLPSTPSSPSAQSQPQVDYVLVFESVPARFKKAGKVPSSEKAAIAREFQLLVERIQDVGLQVTSREGKVGSGQVLLFVRGSDETLVKVGREEG